MAFIESHQTLAGHPKTKRAARLLSIGIPQLIGHLHLLWWWAMDYARDGDLRGYEDEDIAEAALWEGLASEFVDALRIVAFLDEDEDGRVVIHEWDEYAGRLIAKRRADAARKRASRLGLTVQGTSDGRPEDGAGTVPNLTVPNHAATAAARTRAGDESEHARAPTTVDATGPEQELLAALGAAATPANVRAIGAVRAAYPALDHHQQTAVCAAYYAEHQRGPPDVARYAEWCKRDRGGSTHEAHQQAAGDAGAGGHRRARAGDPGREPASGQHAAHARSLSW